MDETSPHWRTLDGRFGAGRDRRWGRSGGHTAGETGHRRAVPSFPSEEAMRVKVPACSCVGLAVAAGDVFGGSEKAGPDAGGVEQFPLWWIHLCVSPGLPWGPAPLSLSWLVVCESFGKAQSIWYC